MKHLTSRLFFKSSVILKAFLLCFCLFFFSCEKDDAVSEDITQEEMEGSDDMDASDDMETEDDSNESENNDSTDESGDDEDADGDMNDETDSDSQTDDCPSTIGFLFEENNSIISIEFEDNTFPEGWVLKNNGTDFSGDGYMQWEGNPSLGNPGNGLVVFPIRITNPGTYRFTWYSSFQRGNNGTEHNDSWLRFPDADDFFGRKENGDIVYPKGSGKQPNPEGASSDGWFKIYRSGNDNAFKWQARTSDNDAHDIFVSFEEAGVFLMEISARSDYHAIDRILLFEESINQNDAIQAADTFSQKITCD